MLITIQPNPSWQLSLAQLSPSLFKVFVNSVPPIPEENIGISIGMNFGYRFRYDWKPIIGIGIMICKKRNPDMRSKIIWGLNRFCLHKIFGSQIWVLKISSIQKVCVSKTFGSLNILGPKTFWVRGNMTLGPKCLRYKKFWVKKIRFHKIRFHKILVSKKYWPPIKLAPSSKST